MSALDPIWMDGVDASSGLFIVAQGLLMYLEPPSVRRLLAGIAERFPGADLIFDVVPPWFSRLTVMGLQQTPQYRLPAMPWGIGRASIAATLRGWHWRFSDCVFLDYGAPRGWRMLLARALHELPSARHELPCLVHVTMTTTDRTTSMMKQDTGIGGVIAAATLNASRTADLARAASCTTPAALGAAQHGFMVAFLERAAANFVALGMLTLKAQEAAMAPIHKQLAENVGRLTA